jgi:hypothetical protein
VRRYSYWPLVFCVCVCVLFVLAFPLWMMVMKSIPPTAPYSSSTHTHMYSSETTSG